MEVYFFSSSEFLEIPDNEPRCYLWYTKGLRSYAGIEKVLQIKRIHIEKSIFDDFSQDYPYLIKDLNYSVFELKEDSKKKENINVGEWCFFASNDTIVYLLKKIYKNNESHSRLFVKKGEDAKKNATKIGIDSIEVKGSIPDYKKYDLLVLGNDWGLLEQKINFDFINAGKNTVCVQESVIDFNVKDQRLLRCSIPVFQGIASLKYLDLQNKVCAVIGNPRYEELTFTPINNETRTVLINVNFTYGIFENERAFWLESILKECSNLGLDYLISQHPRDNADLSAYKLVKTNAGTVHDILKSSSILITRFSSLIHEALCLGRPVIYYNPHNENQFYDFEPDGKCLFYATTPEELHLALNELSNNIGQMEMENALKEYLQKHLGITNSGKVSDVIGSFLKVAEKVHISKQLPVLDKLKLDVKVFKRRLFGEKI